MVVGAQEQSRDRLLQAAVAVFAEKGFHHATVRDICRQASANVAAVNYYFRNKEGLYAEALAHAFAEAEQRYPLTAARDRSRPPDQRLHAFVAVFMQRIMDDSALGHHGRLIAREIAEPTAALDHIAQTVMVPVFGLLAEIVPQLVASDLTVEQVQRCVLSILGQCLMFKHSRSVIERICPQMIDDPVAIERGIAHIAHFSLAALAHFSELPAERSS